ncbi:hypothetical protein CHARACLAT_011270 [Characodon lateralis]|uniref:Uncharacterized protein n=1 Tax=Characodon lateralis TaxID=208331 RepID=A0ABU7DFL6_9TELE|nr:hypothetical protein [Characodon lateralis]
MSAQKSREETTTGSTPMTIVVNFLKYETKEKILAKAWKKKIQVEGKQIFFLITTIPIGNERKKDTDSDTSKLDKDRLVRWAQDLQQHRGRRTGYEEERFGDGRAA